MPKKEILKKQLKSLTESKTQQLRSIQNVTQQLMRLKTDLVTDTTNPLKNNDVKYITDTVGKLLKTFDGIHDEKIDDEAVEDDALVVADNEGSEGHGKMPSEVGGLGENVVSLSEKTLKNVIKRVIQERAVNEQIDPASKDFYMEFSKQAEETTHNELMGEIERYCGKRDEHLLQAGQSKRRYSTDTEDINSYMRTEFIGSSMNVTDIIKKVKGYCNTIRSYHGRKPQ
jgi:hypothetical protein